MFYIDRTEQVTGTLSQTNVLQRLHEEFSSGNLKEVADKTIKQLGLGMESPVRVRDVSHIKITRISRQLIIFIGSRTD